MFKQYRILAITLLAVLIATTTSCVDNLNTSPIDDDVVTSASLYETEEDFRQVLAKLYAGFATTGQQGPAGNADIQGIDEGFSSYVRQLWVSQEITTDEAVVGWNDEGLPEFNYHTWGSENDFVLGMYSRVYYEVALTNEFIRNAQGSDNETIQGYNAEARFLRALSYWHALDLYGGGVPFVTEEDGVGAYLPEPIGNQELFNYIESELLAIIGDDGSTPETQQLPDPQQNEYARADKAAAWTLLAKLYLNAEVYIGEAHYTEAITYADRVIEQGSYTLEENYDNLFRADNHTAEGIIFPIAFDGDNIQTFGGTTFIAHAQVGGSMNIAEFGLDAAWAGHRITPQFADKFDEANDGRAMFYTDGQNKEIDNIAEFTDGYAITKWKNITTGGQPGKNLTYVDIDFPMFRLADVYLMYAEAIVRGGQGGDQSKAVGLINDLRERAFGDDSGNITAGELTLSFLIDERGRELYWEGHRRTDLIRFGQFTGSNYVWAYKGGANEQDGTGTNDIYNLFPIPASDVNSNTNLTQNPGY